MSRRRRIALVVIVCVQLALPLAMAGLAAADLAFGQEITLKAQPVDPLDVFRGNYVVLRYEISSLPCSERFGRRDGLRASRGVGGRRGARATPTRVVRQAPSSAAAHATTTSPGESVGIEYGIETYYASAERAREIEASIAQGDLQVVIDLDDDGSARIERLRGKGRLEPGVFRRSP